MSRTQSAPEESTHGDDDGYVVTPRPLAELMARELLDARDDAVRAIPSIDGSRMLFPGLGTGNLYDAVQRTLADKRLNGEPDAFVGVETDQERITAFQRSHTDADITIHNEDFLLNPPSGTFDFIIANPPYVHYNHLESSVRDAYTEETSFVTATAQFKLDHLFVEQMLRLLATDGALVILTPKRTLQYRTNYSRWLRGLLTREDGFRSWLLPEWVFPDHTVQPVMTAVTKSESPGNPSNTVHLDYLYQHQYERLATSDVLNPPDGAHQRYRDQYESLLDNEATARGTRDSDPFHDLSDEALSAYKASCRSEASEASTSSTKATTLSTFGG